jgi:methionyl-tRNA formyltransferase
MASRLAQLGHVPIGALTLGTLDRGTLVRKLGQLGARDFARFAWAKLMPGEAAKPGQVRNPYLEPALRNGEGIFRSLHEVAAFYGFPVTVCDDQNSPKSISHLRAWSPDLAIFTGGNILRLPFLEVPRLGVINSHLALLPEIRGMSSPEWSLLNQVPVGLTIHFMDTGIDTGPILMRREFREAVKAESLTDLRNRMIAFGIELVAETVTALQAGTLSAVEQADRDQDNQFFVMHDWLKARAAARLKPAKLATVAGANHE